MSGEKHPHCYLVDELPPTRRFLAFDLETAKALPTDRPNWKIDRPLGISCAATLASDSDGPDFWHGVTPGGRPACLMTKRDAKRLVRHLATQTKRGYTVVSWNGLGFDFDILAEESGLLDECRSLALGHLDMMFHVLCLLGYGVSLDAAARGMRLPGKSEGVTGAIIPQLWAKRQHKRVLDYIAGDVQMTLDLARTCQEHGVFRWITRRGRTRTIVFSDGWLVVQKAQELPEPIVTRRSKTWSRTRFTEWLH